MKSVCFVIVVFLTFSTSFSRQLRFDKDGKPGRVKFNVTLTDSSQILFADSLATKLIPRFMAFSEERKDFVLVKPSDSADYSLNIGVLGCQIVPYEKQLALARKRGRVEKKYEAINDSIDNISKSERTGTVVAANIVANAIPALLLGPMSLLYIKVLTPDDLYPAAVPNRKDQRKIDSTYSVAHLSIFAELVFGGKTIWKRKNHEEFKLTYPTLPSEQIQVLTRNSLLAIEDRLPFFKELR